MLLLSVALVLGIFLYICSVNQHNLSTARCLLRPLDQRDVQGIYNIRSDQRMAQFVDRILCTTHQEAAEFIAKIIEGTSTGEWHYWAVLSKEPDETFQGTVCLWNFSQRGLEAEIGYELLPQFQGRGLMVEVVQAVVQFGFDVLRLQHINGVAHADHHKSLQVLKSAGFHFLQQLPLSMVEYTIEK